MNKTLSIPALVAAAALFGSAATPALAVEDKDLRFDTTAELYRVCAVTEQQPEYPITNQACRAFIEAAVQYHDAVSKQKQLPRLICYPSDATIEDGKNTFLAWAAQNAGDQKLMGELPVVGLVRSLAAKYPCKGKG